MNIIKNNKILTNISTLGSATMVNALLSLVLGIITRNILGPEQYGYWLTVSIVFTFTPLFQLGTLNAMNREVPFYLVKNDYKKVKEIRETVFSFLFTLPAVLVFSLLISSVITWNYKIETEYKVALPLLAIITIFLFLSNYIEMHYKSEQNFSTASKLISIKSISQTILTVILVYIYGYIGLYVGMILSLILQILLGKKAFPKFKGFHKIAEYKELIRTGFPILLVGIIWSIMLATDRIIISLFMTSEDVGNYGVGLMVLSSMMLLPQVVSQVMYPKIVGMVSLEQYTKINELYWKVNKILAICMAIIVFIIYMLLPNFIEIFMPQYVDGTRAAQILLIGLYPLTLVNFAAAYFNSTNNQRVYMTIQVLAIVINVVLSLILIFVDKSIVSVAFATAISFLIYSLMMNAVFFMKFKKHSGNVSTRQN